MSGKSYTVNLNVIGDATKAKKELSDVGDAAEKSSGRLSKTFGSTLAGLSKASGGALEPLVAGFEHVQRAMEETEGKGRNVGAMLTGIGAGAIGVGALLTGMGDKDKQANQQLRATIETTGQSYEDYAGKIEAAIRAEEKHGHTANQTQDALRILTQATGDPAKALQYLGTASDYAASKHEDLSTAAEKLGKAYNGSTKILKEFHLEAGPKLVGAMKAAQAATNQAAAADAAAEAAKKRLADMIAVTGSKAQVSVGQQIALRNAQDAVAKAEQLATDGTASHIAALVTAKQRLSDTEARQAAGSKLSVGAEIGLRNAHDAVTAALAKAEESHKKLAAAQDTVTKAGGTQTDTMDALAKKLHGQADAAADSLSGRMRALKAEIEDGAAKIGQKYGPALTGLGAGMTVLGGLWQTGAGLVNKFKGAQEAATVAQDAMNVAETEGAVAEGLALGPILLIIAAIALLGLGVYELVTHWKTVWRDVQGAVDTAGQFVSGVLDGMKNDFMRVVSFVEGIPGDIAHVGEAIGKGLANGWIWGINNVISAWDWLVGMLKIPGFDIGPVHFGGLDIGSSLKISQIPYLDAGGIVSSPMLAGLAMNSRPEIIAPLSSLPQILTTVSGASGGSNAAGALAGGLTIPITLEIDGTVLVKKTIRVTRTELNKMSKGSTTLPNQ